MFKSLRLRLTLWFVLFSGLVYVLLLLAGGSVFYASMTRALDDELVALSTEIMPLVILEREDLQIRGLKEKVHGRLLAGTTSAQLFDARERFDEQHGIEGVKTLYKNPAEFMLGDVHVRSRSVPLMRDEKTIGFLQVQIPTDRRDRSMREFLTMNLILGPALLIALALSGYLFSGKAVKPVEDSFVVLRMFVADAGHELKTPLSIIQATAENLSEDLKDKPDLNNQVSIISRTTERMTHLVQDMLLLAKMEVQQITVQMAALNLKDLIIEVAEEHSSQFAEQNKRLIVADMDDAEIVGDRDSLHRLFANLLENALRYSDQGAEAVVSIARKEDRVVARVKDTGIGIPKDSIPRLFDRFYRVDKSRTRAKGGSGLGLAIVKATADLHSAEVSVSSEEGKGSEFVVIFPARA